MTVKPAAARGRGDGGKGEGDVFFEDVVGEVGSGVGASVGGVEEDDAVRGAGLLGGRGKREDAATRSEG